MSAATTEVDFEIRPLNDVMGAEVVGLDPARLLDREVGKVLLGALLEHLVICIRDQDVPAERFVDACRIFGEPKRQLLDQWRLEHVSEVQIIASDIGDRVGGKPIVQGAHWHTDDSYFAEPAKATALHAVEIPERGGDTHFANMYAVYDALPRHLAERIASMRAVHRYQSSRGPNPVAERTEEEKAKTPDVTHPLVRTHPDTGRRAVYINPNRIECVDGLAREQSDALLDALYAHAFEERFHYRHVWGKRDIVVWDNRCTMHHANADFPSNERRVLHRVMLRGDVPV